MTNDGRQLGARAIAVSLALIAVGCTTAEQQQARAQAQGGQCFNPGTVSGFDSVDRDTVRVTVGATRVFELDILGTCPEIDWSRSIGLRSTGGSNWVCSGMDAELLAPSPTGVDVCPVLGVRQLSAAEVEALRAARRR